MLTLLTALTLVTPTAPLPAAAPVPEGEKAEIAWFEGDLEAALERARAEHAPVVLYFWMNGSENCSALWEHTLQTPEVAACLNKGVVLSVPHHDAARYPLFERYRVSTVPALLVLTGDGVADDGLTGFSYGDNLVSELERMFERRNTVSDLEGRLEKARPGSPDALEAAWRLADRVGLLGDRERADALLESVREADPKGRTRAGAEVKLADAMEAAWAEVESDDDLPDTSEVLTLAKKSKVREVRFKAWNWLSGVRARTGDAAGSMAALQEAFEVVSDEELCEWAGDRVAGVLGEDLSALSSKDRRFLLSAMRDVVARAEEVDPEGVWWRQNHPVLPYERWFAFRIKTLGDAYAANGDEDEAQAAYARARGLAPDLPGLEDATASR